MINYLKNNVHSVRLDFKAYKREIDFVDASKLTNEYIMNTFSVYFFDLVRNLIKKDLMEWKIEDHGVTYNISGFLNRRTLNRKIKSLNMKMD